MGTVCCAEATAQLAPYRRVKVIVLNQNPPRRVGDLQCVGNRRRRSGVALEVDVHGVDPRSKAVDPRFGAQRKRSKKVVLVKWFQTFNV